MPFAYADLISVYLIEARDALKARCEEDYSDRLKAAQFRALRNLIKQIRDPLPDEYGKLEIPE